MQHKYKTLAAVAFALSYFAWCVPTAAHAQSAPRTLSYQGVLKHTGCPWMDDTNPAGLRLLTITLYGDAYGGSKLWQKSGLTEIDSMGIFNVTLGGDDNPLPEPQAMDRPIWLGVAVDNGPEMRPLSEMTASAYALNVVDNAITTAKIADSSITPSKLNLDYISSININGVQFTGHGTPLNIQGENGITAAYKADSNTLVLSGPNSKAQGDWVSPSNTNPPGCPGTPNTDGTVATNTVSGGCSNNATATGGFATIGGGQDNKALSTWSTVGGGDTNIAGADYATVAGGWFNIAEGPRAAIGGGSFNYISTGGGAIAGGDSNTINMGATSGVPSFIGGGDSNKILNPDGEQGPSVIGGGYHNTVLEGPSIVGGGFQNIIYEELGEIVGGENNVDSLDAGFIGGGIVNTLAGGDIEYPTGLTLPGSSAIVSGAYNYAQSAFSFIGDGYQNSISNGNFSTIAGGRYNITLSNYAAIGGGDTNKVDADYGFIGGGFKNHVEAAYGTIAGGDTNVTTNDHGSIGGGKLNLAEGAFGTIAGGKTNILGSKALKSTIGGGELNLATDTASFIGGGENNIVRSNHATLAGGELNIIDTLADASFLGGGVANKIGSYGSPQFIDDTAYFGAAVLGGGMNDTVKAVWGSMVGGHFNKIDTFARGAFIGAGWGNAILLQAHEAVITGGDSNKVMTAASFIGAGSYNVIPNVEPPIGQLSGAAIVAGTQNYDSAQYAIIGGGEQNTINGRNTFTNAGGQSFIGAGFQNTVSNEGSFIGTGADDTIIAGGSGVAAGHNSKIESSANYSFIGAGETNIIDTGSADAAIVSGNNNVIDTNAPYSIIGGGASNHIIASTGFIGGGGSNLIQTGSNYGTIGGGLTNLIDTSDPYATIGGGDLNHILPNNGHYATIPGGDSLIANSFAQTVVGYNNLMSGTFTQGTPHTFAAGGPQELPILIIGNGNGRGVNPRSNAFEVSYDGHSIVTDALGNSGPVLRPPVFGGTYNDNIVYAWGDVPRQLGGSPALDPPTADFGVDPTASVNHVAVGIYIVTLNSIPGSGFHNFTEASITATGEDNTPIAGPNPPPGCIEITCSEIGNPLPNQFIVRTYENCTATDEAFFFKVCGR